MSKGNSNANDAGNQPVATVNGKTIPAKVYEMYLKNGRAALELDPNSDEGRRKLDQLREGIVSELIDRALIREESAAARPWLFRRTDWRMPNAKP